MEGKVDWRKRMMEAPESAMMGGRVGGSREWMDPHSGWWTSRKWETSGGTPGPASLMVGSTASLTVGWCLESINKSATPASCLTVGEGGEETAKLERGTNKSATPASCLTVGEGGEETAKLERGTLASKVLLSNRPGWGEGCWEREWLMCGW